MNYAVLDEGIYFHSAPKGRLASRDGAPAVAAVEDTLTWLPSTWRHAELACPATTYYRSVVVEGRLVEVEDLELKACVLQAFMERYQPEGGYVPLADARYRGPLQALTVLELVPEGCGCKVKMGQHLTPAQRETIYGKLVERGDLECARAMLRANPELQKPLHGWIEDAARLPAEQIHSLLQTTYWAERRDLARVRTHLEEAALNLGYAEEGWLLAYARATLPMAETGWLFDVVVHPERRGQGLGQALVERLLAHPRLAGLRRIFLDTRDAATLYAKYGFREVARDENPTRILMLRGRV
jgi:N-acetylglutamate synthase-like GNAT family acetyltransferase